MRRTLWTDLTSTPRRRWVHSAARRGALAGSQKFRPTRLRSNNPTLADSKTANPDYSPVTQISGYQSKIDGMVYRGTSAARHRL